jgi:hypothetical protein
MRSLAHMREMDEALDDWERYKSLPLERLLKERDLDRKHLVNFRDEVKRILCHRSSKGE